MKKLTAFTLGEVLVVIGIIGIIATILLPVINEMQPDRRKVMFKKGYATIERIVTELVNDEHFYPEALGKVGLDNTTTDVFASVTGGAGVSGPGLNLNATDGPKKFCKLFAFKVNTVDSINVNCPADLDTNTPSFTTTDSIEFYIDDTDFATGDGGEEIVVDVNGQDGPNCTMVDNPNCTSPDRFTVVVYADGRIRIHEDDTVAQEYLKSTSVVKKEVQQ